MELLVTAADQVAIEGVAGITLSKLWYEVGRELRRQLSNCHKLRIVSYLLSLPQYKCFYLDEARKLSILPPLNEPLCIYGTQERNYPPDQINFNTKSSIPSPQVCPAVTEFGFCPDRYKRIELEDMDPEDVLLYDPDRLTIVASYSDRVRALLPSDFCPEEVQIETFSNFMMMEYLAKCRERGALIQEMKEDWAPGMDLYALIAQLWRTGVIHKEMFSMKTKSEYGNSNVVRILLSRFVDKPSVNSEVEEKLPDNVVVFDKAFADYKRKYPNAQSMPRKFLKPYFNDDLNLLKRNVEAMKAHGYIKTVYVERGQKSKDFEHTYFCHLERMHPKPKLHWSNSIACNGAPAVAPELIEPDQTMASLYRDLLNENECTLNNISAYTGCHHYVARGVDKHFSSAYKDSISNRLVEISKTVTTVRGTVVVKNEQTTNNESPSLNKASLNTSGVSVPNESSHDNVGSSQKDSASAEAKARSRKKGVANGQEPWRDFLGKDLLDYGIVLQEEDFTFKHKFFRTDLQKLRRAVVLKHLQKVAVAEINVLAHVVDEVEKILGMSNPTWDRKSRRRFMDVLSSEGLINQMGVKYDRNGLEKEVHLIVIPGVDENHQLVHKLVSDKATVRFTERDAPTTLQILMDNNAAHQTDGVQMDHSSMPGSEKMEQPDVPPVLMLDGGRQMSVLEAEQQQMESWDCVDVGIMDKKVYSKNTNGHNGMIIPDPPVKRDDASGLGSVGLAMGGEDVNSGASESEAFGWRTGGDAGNDCSEGYEVTFGQLVPHMHCVKMLHSILLYMVYGVNVGLLNSSTGVTFKHLLDSFMLTPSVYNHGWILYSDLLDMLPMKVVAMFLEKYAFTPRLKCLSHSLLSGDQIVGNSHPTLRSVVVTNSSVASRLWCFVKVLCNLGLVSLLKSKVVGERKRPKFVYLHRNAAFYDTSRAPESEGQGEEYPVLKFDFVDGVTVVNYWDRLRDVCVQSSLNQSLQLGPSMYLDRFAVRKYRPWHNSALNMDSFYVDKATNIQEYKLPVATQFGAAGTDVSMSLQDPVHWYAVTKANQVTRKILRQYHHNTKVNVDSRSILLGCGGSKSTNLSSKMRVKRITEKAKKKVVARSDEKAIVVKPAVNKNNFLRKREVELQERQKRINMEIGRKKMMMRVMWQPEEDAVMIYAYATLGVMRAHLNVPLVAYGFFIRDILHSLLPEMASNKNEWSIMRRFRYLLNNDYRSCLYFFGLKALALKSPSVLTTMSQSIATLTDEELYIYYTRVYNALVHCNATTFPVTPDWTLSQLESHFHIDSLFPQPFYQLLWDFSQVCRDTLSWKKSLHEVMLCLSLNYFFEKQFEPHSASTVALAKLLSVNHISDIMKTVFEKLENKLLCSNSKMFKQFPKYRRFISFLYLNSLPKFVSKLFLSWPSRGPISKLLVSIYEDELMGDLYLGRLLSGRQQVCLREDDKQSAHGVFEMICAMDCFPPCFSLSLYVTEPLFEFPKLKESSAVQSKVHTRMFSMCGSDSEDEDLEEDDEEDDDSFYTSVPKSCLIDSGLDEETYNMEESGTKEKMIEGVEQILSRQVEREVPIVKKDEELRLQQLIGFDKAEAYRSIMSVTSQEKDHEIVMNIPSLSLVPKGHVVPEDDQLIAEYLNGFYLKGDFTGVECRTLFDLLLVKSPSDVELLPQMPLYVTTSKEGIVIDKESWSPLQHNVYSLIHSAQQDGLDFQTLLEGLNESCSEPQLLDVLADLITSGAILVTGTNEMKLCAREFCPFFTSLRCKELVAAHRVPPDRSFVSVKFLPNAFLNWDASFCPNLFTTLISWTVETCYLVPGVNFVELQERVSSFISLVHFMRLVKFGERLKMLTLEVHKDADVLDSDCWFSSDDVENEKIANRFDMKSIYVFPSCDSIFRLKSFCARFNLSKHRHLSFISPQRVNFYSAAVDLFKIRKLFDPHLQYYD